MIAETVVNTTGSISSCSTWWFSSHMYMKWVKRSSEASKTNGCDWKHEVKIFFLPTSTVKNTVVNVSLIQSFGDVAIFTIAVFIISAILFYTVEQNDTFWFGVIHTLRYKLVWLFNILYTYIYSSARLNRGDQTLYHLNKVAWEWHWIDTFMDDYKCLRQPVQK